MRKVILTQENNILLFAPSDQGLGLVLPANEYVDLAVAYKDKFHQPITRHRLMWRLVKGQAILRQPTTLTNGKGYGINRIKVQLDDPDAQATVRLAVWPQNEPDSELEFECKFGAPDAAPPVTDGNVLKTVFPRDDASGRTRIYASTLYWRLATRFLFLYADNRGNIIRGSTINYKFSGGLNHLDKYTSEYNSYLYTTSTSIFSEVSPETLDISTGNMESTSSLTITDISDPTIQVNNFWPPAESILEPGVTYPLRALLTGGDGTVLPWTIRWALADDSPNSSIASISPETCPVDVDGFAVSTITLKSVPAEGNRTVKLCVSIEGVREGPTVVYDFPSFSVSAPNIMNVLPTSDKILPAGLPTQFTAALQNEAGEALPGMVITWEASGIHLGDGYFDPPVSITNKYGQASSFFVSKGVPQGTTQKFTVTITPPYGAPYIENYTLQANTITQTSPTSSGPFDIDVPLTVWVKITDPDGRGLASRTLKIAPNDDLDISNKYLETAPNGSASFNVTAHATISTNVLVYENTDYSVPTSIPLTFARSSSTPTITLATPASGDMRYDTWLPASATLTDTSGQPVSGAPLTWSCTNGVQLENTTTTTGPDGTTSNRFRYETLTGYPNPAITTTLAVTTRDGTSNSQQLTFTKSSLYNSLRLISPAEGSQLLIQQPTIVTLQLTNQFGHPLGNYAITWEDPSDDAVILDSDPKTDLKGNATATVKGTVTGLAQFDASAQLAHAPCAFTYDFVDLVLPDCSVLLDKNYAHNPPAGSGKVNPFDDSQVITFTFRYLSNNVPQSGKEIVWYVNPRTTDLQFFNAQNAAVNVTSQGDIITKTDSEGLTVLKIGSLTRFLGTVGAMPSDDTSTSSRQYSIVIATFTSSDINPGLVPALYNPNPIAIPSRFSTADPGFEVNTAFLPGNVSGQSVVFWISSGAPGKTPQENIKIVTVNAAQQGITVPYSYVYPDPNPTGYNAISYMVVQRTTSSSTLARSVTPVVIGNPMSNHPDYNNTNRNLPSPHLNNYANVVNGNSIVSGLDVYIPYSTSWVAGQTINLSLYLNGEDDMGHLIGNTVIQKQIITATQITAKTDIMIHFIQEQLIGYNAGTLEADYYIGEAWSQILEGVVLDTADWQ